MTVSSVSDLQKKYARSVFEMEFLEDGQKFVEVLSRISWLSKPEISPDHGHPVVRVAAVDIARARKELPVMIGASGLTLTRYELVMPGLEDIFMHIINGRDAK